MSISKRLLNVARAELNDLFKKLSDEEAALSDEELEAIREEARKRSEKDRPGTRSASVSVDLSRYYANLELPLGASAAEVRAAYRRLMRRYHPDKHHTDDQRRETATVLAQELRVAYEALLIHLEGPGTKR